MKNDMKNAAEKKYQDNMADTKGNKGKKAPSANDDWIRILEQKINLKTNTGRLRRARKKK